MKLFVYMTHHEPIANEGDELALILDKDNDNQKVAVVIFNPMGYEVRTPSLSFPDDLNKYSDFLIGVYEKEAQILDGIKRFYDDLKDQAIVQAELDKQVTQYEAQQEAFEKENKVKKTVEEIDEHQMARDMIFGC